MITKILKRQRDAEDGGGDSHFEVEGDQEEADQQPAFGRDTVSCFGEHLKEYVDYGKSVGDVVQPRGDQLSDPGRHDQLRLDEVQAPEEATSHLKTHSMVKMEEDTYN